MTFVFVRMLGPHSDHGLLREYLQSDIKTKVYQFIYIYVEVYPCAHTHTHIYMHTNVSSHLQSSLPWIPTNRLMLLSKDTS